MATPTDIVISVIAGSTGTINMPIRPPSRGDVEGSGGTSDSHHVPPVIVRVIGNGQTRALMEVIVEGRRIRVAELNGEGEITISGSTISQIVNSVGGDRAASLQFQFEHLDTSPEWLQA